MSMMLLILKSSAFVSKNHGAEEYPSYGNQGQFPRNRRLFGGQEHLSEGSLFIKATAGKSVCQDQAGSVISGNKQMAKDAGEYDCFVKGFVD